MEDTKELLEAILDSYAKLLEEIGELKTMIRREGTDSTKTDQLVRGGTASTKTDQLVRGGTSSAKVEQLIERKKKTEEQNPLVVSRGDSTNNEGEGEKNHDDIPSEKDQGDIPNEKNQSDILRITDSQNTPPRSIESQDTPPRGTDFQNTPPRSIESTKKIPPVNSEGHLISASQPAPNSKSKKSHYLLGNEALISTPAKEKDLDFFKALELEI